MGEIGKILTSLDFSPLFISLKTGVAATILSFFLGIYAARKCMYAKAGVKAVLDGIHFIIDFQYQKTGGRISLYDI